MYITDINTVYSIEGMKTDITATLTQDENWVLNSCASEVDLINPKETKMNYANGEVNKPFSAIMPSGKLPSIENTSWEFHSSSEDDIYWKDIRDSLSYAEPLALVTRKYRDYTGEDKYIVISKELWDKSHTLGMLKYSPNIISKIEKRVFCIGNNFSDWVDWAKAVKAASWPEPVKSTINVVLPTV